MICCCFVNTVRKANTLGCFKYCSTSQVFVMPTLIPLSLPAHLSTAANTPLYICASRPLYSASVLFYVVSTYRRDLFSAFQYPLSASRPLYLERLTPKFSEFQPNERCVGKKVRSKCGKCNGNDANKTFRSWTCQSTSLLIALIPP